MHPLKPLDKQDIKSERSFGRNVSILRLVLGQLSIPQPVQEDAAILYRKCIDTKMTRGRNVYSLCLAIAVLMCEEWGIGRDISKVALDLGTKMEDVESCVKAINNKFGKGEKDQKLRQLVQEGLDRINATEELRRKTIEIMEYVIANMSHKGKKSEVVAAYIMYSAARNLNIAINRSEVARNFGISEKSLRRKFN
jgi:transcription initiation factor TFIIIB Brf1 subunit/transcription initiation factor TFIIB